MNNDNLPIIEGEPSDKEKTPDKQDELKLQKYLEMKFASPDKLDEISKSFITLVGTLSTIYFAAAIFSKILTYQWWFKVISITPILLWLSALACALTALRPQEYNVIKGVPSSVDGFLENIGKHKYLWLKRSGWLIFAGLVMLMVTLIVYIFDPCFSCR